MNSLFELLKDQVGDKFSQEVGNQFGLNEEQTNAAMQSVFSAMMSGLSKNVSQPSGAESLISALDRDHDGSIIENLMGYLNGESQVANPNALNGAGILNHVLGGNQSNVIEAIAKMIGIDANKSGKLMVTFAPIIMGLLGKMKNNSGVGNSGLLDLIMKTGQPPQPVQEQATPSSGLMGVFGKLLDQDGDGSIMDDLASMGMKTLFRK